MIKLTCNTARFLSALVLVVAFLTIYTSSSSTVPKLFNSQLIHQVVRPLLRSTPLTDQQNATLRTTNRRRPHNRSQTSHLSNRKRHLLQTSETNTNPATQVDSKENEIIPQPESPNRSLASINGAVDPKKYSNDELDRLYGDALLVYMKNFNDTLPARKNVRYVNGTRVPVFQSRTIRIQN